jgi:hypothetical protein
MLPASNQVPDWGAVCDEGKDLHGKILCSQDGSFVIGGSTPDSWLSTVVSAYLSTKLGDLDFLVICLFRVRPLVAGLKGTRSSLTRFYRFRPIRSTPRR